MSGIGWKRSNLGPTFAFDARWMPSLPGVWGVSQQNRTIASTPGVGQKRSTSGLTFTSDACRTPQYWEFGQLADRTGQLILHWGLDGKG
jgi:hypothetical protein